MTHGNRPLARLQSLRYDRFTILPQPSSKADTEPMLEDLSDFLERQARHFGVEKVDQDPAGAADSGVEAKCAGWCHALHHGEKGRRDDDVGTPAGTSSIYQLQSRFRRVEESKSLRLLTKSGTLFPSHALPWERNLLTSMRCCLLIPHKRRRTR